MREYNLVIEYDNGIISIPFGELMAIDEFTMQFDTRDELFNFLNRSLNLAAKRKNISNIYIKHTYTKRTEGKKTTYEILDIKYNLDNYDKQSVIDNYIKYYCDKPGRILSYGGIRHINHNAINDYKNGGNKLNDNDIALAVMSYFRKNSYKAYRDAYFLLKKNGYKVKTYPAVNTFDKKNLSNYDIKDEYVESLARGVKEGKLDEEEVMDELAGMDMEELKKNASNHDYGIFDGMNIEPTQEAFDKERMLSLTELSNKSLEELLKLVEDYRQEYNKGKKR